MNHKEQQPIRETSESINDALGSIAMNSLNDMPVPSMDEQVSRSWSLHLSGVDTIPIIKL